MLVQGSVNHYAVFQEIARELQHYWILVRATNVWSLEYIGRTGQYQYAPKRIDCKAKTAKGDVPGKPWKLKGLVASPYLHPLAFTDLNDAKEQWANTRIISTGGKNSGPYYSVDLNEKSQHYGCLMFDGKYIHGDYDLFDIVDIRRPKGNLALLGSLHGKDHASGANLKWIQQIINTRLGVDMVQHGAEAQRLDHLEKDEVIDVFTPAGQHLTKSNLAELKELYATTFKGRITLSDRFPQSSFSSTEVSRGQFENVTPISVHKNYPGFKKR